MTHIFDVDLAKEYTIEIAIMINHMTFWLQKNKANKKHIHEGKVWTYNTAKAFTEIFQYWNENQVRHLLKVMEEKEIITVGNYNINSYDRTKWYTFTDAFLKSHKSICEICQMEVEKVRNGSEKSANPIPDSLPVGLPSDSSDISIVLVDEVIEYLNEKSGKNYRVTPSTSSLILARISEGFTKDDCFTVIDNKVATWKGTEWEKFLRPETLFCASKFQGYLNEKPAEKRHAGSKEGYSVDLSKYETL